MKKLIALLLTLSTLFAASCAAVKTGDDGTTETRKAPDEQTTAGEGTTAEEQTTADEETTEEEQTTAEETTADNIAIVDDVTTVKNTPTQDPNKIIEVSVINMTLEKLMYLSDNVLKARFISKTVDGTNVIYSFNVLEEYYGKTERKTIDEVFSTIWGLPTDIPYEKDKEYYLVLRDDGDQYSGGKGKWTGTDYEMYLPVGDVSKMTVCGKPLKENSDIEKLENDNDFVDHLKSVIAREDFPKPKEKKYIMSDNMEEIVSHSEVIFAIKVNRELHRGVNEINGTKDFFLCEVSEVYKGNIEVGASVDAVFVDGTVAIDDTVIFAGYIDEATGLYKITSPSSVYKMTEKDNIIALIEEQK